MKIETPVVQMQSRRAWIEPTSECLGSVAQLVQIAKTSGHSDCGNSRRNGTGSHC